MSDLRVSVCCGALVSPIQGDPCCCECGRENVMTETISERDHRMRVEGARLVLGRCGGYIELGDLKALYLSNPGARDEAAEQAENARLREALECLLPGLVLDVRYAEADNDIGAMRSRVRTVTEALAARQPDAALREVCRKVQGATWAAAGPTVEMDAKKCNVILDAILGPEVTR